MKIIKWAKDLNRRFSVEDTQMCPLDTYKYAQHHQSTEK